MKKQKRQWFLGEVIALDDDGRTFKKLVWLVHASNDELIVDFGWPIQYQLEGMVDWDQTKHLCIDIGGRNHRGSPVHVRVEDWTRILTEALKIRKRLVEESIIEYDHPQLEMEM